MAFKWPPIGMSTILHMVLLWEFPIGMFYWLVLWFPKESLIWSAPSKVHSLVPFWFALCFSSLVGFTLLSLRWPLGFYTFHLSFFFPTLPFFKKGFGQRRSPCKDVPMVTMWLLGFFLNVLFKSRIIIIFKSSFSSLQHQLVSFDLIFI